MEELDRQLFDILVQHIYMNGSSDHQNDSDLVTQVLAGHREAFGRLVSPYYASVLRLSVRLLSDPVEAQDVAQEAILQAFLGLDRLQQPERFGAWLYAIASNLARSSLRRRQPVSFEELDTTGQWRLQRAALFPSLEQVVALRETHDTIVAALMELSVVNREAVVGYYLQGYTYAELAVLLGVPVSTIRSRLFKGRQQLRQHLKHLRQSLPLPLVRIRKEFPTMPELIPLQVEMICEYALTQRSILVLRTLAGDRYLPIKLTSDEAVTLERALKSLPAAPSVTNQDTVLQIVSRLGGRIEQIIVRSLAKQNYYASLVIAQDGQHQEIDCRLGDALALAVRAQITILSAPALLEESSIIIEAMDIDPVVTEAELSEPVEPVTVSDAWPDTFIEQVWSFLLSVLTGHRGNRAPHDLSRLRSVDWNELIPAREAEWDGQIMQVVRLPAVEPAWLVVRPALWKQVRDFVECIQQRETPYPPESSPVFIPLAVDQQKQVDELLAGAWPQLTNLGVRSLALMHLDGHLVSWKSLDGYEEAIRMGRAAVRDLAVARHLAALVDVAAEPAIRITYERSTAFNPAQAAGPNVVSTSETLLHNGWLLVIGWSSDQGMREGRKQLEQLREDLTTLLPS